MSCSSSPELVKVNVRLDDARNTWIYLCRWDGERNVVVDSSESNSKGLAKLRFFTSNSDVLAITTDKVLFPIVLIVKSGEVVEIRGSLANYSIVGSRESAVLKGVQDKLNLYHSELKYLQSQLPDSIKTLAEDSISKSINFRVDSLNREVRNYGISHMRSNYFSFTSIFVLMAYADSVNELFPYSEYSKEYIKTDSCLSMVYKGKPIVESFRNYIYSKEKLYSLERNAVRLEVGNTIPSLSFNLIDGRTVNIPGIWAQLILIDFWSDWCSVCKKQPYMYKQLYRDFAKKGFVIVQVAADYSEDSLKSIITRDTLDWMHVTETDPYNSTIFNSLGVVKLPSNFLVDRRGRIIATNIYGDSLVNKLRSVLDRPIRLKPVVDSSATRTDSFRPAVKLMRISTGLQNTSVKADSISLPR
ncbi:MAG: TlpA family protein disulfide reductase [Bacteroidales bacterium]